MTRQEAVDRLCDVYAGSYDVTRCEENEHALAATMDFYATAEKYVLSKKAKLWQANSFEYVYLFNVPHLTKEIYERVWPASSQTPPICIPTSPRCLSVTAATKTPARH